MYLSEALHEEATRDHSSDLGHNRLYRTVLEERHGVVQQKSGRLYWDTLWNSLAPKGNIYRYTGLVTEQLQNSADLWKQLDELAEEHKKLLEGNTHEQRTLELCKALARVQVKGAPDPEKGKNAVGASEGFEPLEEFLKHGKACFLGPIAMPTDLASWRAWSSFISISLMVCGIQWIAPLVIFMYEWEQPHNKLNDFNKFNGKLSAHEVFCLGTNNEDRLHTLMGVILLELIVVIIHKFVREQRENSQKESRLPMCRWWYILGNLTNMWCCVMTAFAVPVLLWGEGSPTSIAMDSLSSLFIFTLDDFAGYATSYTGITDGDFQRATAWQLALLSQCPVYLRDLVNPAAKHVDELWRISFDADGRLQAASPQAADGRLLVVAPKTSRAGLGLCATRIERVMHQETAPLQAGSYALLYRTYPRDPGSQLPRWEASALSLGWSFLDVLFSVLQVVMPIVWMAVNHACGPSSVTRQVLSHA